VLSALIVRTDSATMCHPAPPRNTPQGGLIPPASQSGAPGQFTVPRRLVRPRRSQPAETATKSVGYRAGRLFQRAALADGWKRSNKTPAPGRARRGVECVAYAVQPSGRLSAGRASRKPAIAAATNSSGCSGGLEGTRRFLSHFDKLAVMFMADLCIALVTKALR